MKLPPMAKAGLLVRVKRFSEGTTRRGNVDDLGKDLLELRHRVGNNPYRLIFFVYASPEGATPVALTCFYKNSQKTPQDDRDRAAARMKAYKNAYSENQAGS